MSDAVVLAVVSYLTTGAMLWLMGLLGHSREDWRHPDFPRGWAHVVISLILPALLVVSAWMNLWEWWRERRLVRARRRGKMNRAAQEGGGRFGQRGPTPAEWLALLEACKHTCVMCDRSAEFVELTKDHVMPLKLGGEHSIWNIQPLCRPCNTYKGSNWVKDFRTPEQISVLKTLLSVRRLSKEC